MTSSNETFSALLALCEGNLMATDGFPSQRPVTLGLMFSLMSAWRNGWAKGPDAGDLRHHSAHCHVTVMCIEKCFLRIDGFVQDW